MTRPWFLLLCGMMPVLAGEMPEKAAGYHEALRKRPESEALFTRFRDAWLEERPAAELETELLSRAEAGEPGAWGLLGRARLAAGADDGARTAFAKAIEAEPAAAWLRLARAKLLLAAKDFAAAEKDALAVPAGDPRRAEALKLAGLACLRGERVDDALGHWQQAVEAAPGDKALLEDLTELTRREGRSDLALDFCAKWRDATDDAYGKAMATLKRSELLLASQRFDEAIRELGEVLKASGDGSWLEREALARSEQAYQRYGNATGWVEQIAEWAEANPVRLNFRRAQAQALAAAGDPAAALEVLAEVLKRVPGDRDARWQRIGLLERDLKVRQAFDECSALAAEEKSEEAGLRLAELAFRLEKKDEVKKALDDVIVAADPAKRVNLAGLYARYGLPEESEKQWRAAAGGESGGQALRELAKHLRAAGREREALETWKEIGRRDAAQDRIDAAAALAAAGEKEAARDLLDEGLERFSAEPGYQAMRAELALMEDRRADAQAIHRERLVRAQRPDEMLAAIQGWLRAAGDGAAEAARGLGESTGERCLRAAVLAEAGQPLPAVAAGDELERTVRLALLRQHARWPEAVALLEASGGSGPLFLSELCDAKFSAGDTAGALAAAKAWRERAPDQPGPWLKEADLLTDGGDTAAAEALLRRAAARFESDENVARSLFGLLEKNRDTVAALNLAWQRHDQAEEAGAKSGWLREILRVSKDGHRLDDFKERLEARVLRDPASPGPLVALADLARMEGDTEVEFGLMTRAAARAPRDVAVVSRLAELEEKMGRRERALERHAELARLAPGPDSARQFARAKLRCGDIVGGIRDLRALAGDAGVDARDMEQTALSMAARGFVEEALELLGTLDPAQVDARLHFVLGSLLEADGREAEAIDHFLKVMAEPDDPAEIQRHRLTLQILLAEHEGGNPSAVRQVSVPGGLAQAKWILPSRILRLAALAGGDSWQRAAAVIPALASTTPEHWREVKAFAGQGKGVQSARWWDFIERYPANPLGPEILFETLQQAACTPEQVDTLLRREPPVSPRLALSLRLTGTEAAAPTVEWLEALDPAAWCDELAVASLLGWVERSLLEQEKSPDDDPEARARLGRALAVLEKAAPLDRASRQFRIQQARLALLAGDAEAFLAGVQRALELNVPPAREPVGINEMSGNLSLVLARWKSSKGEAAFESLVERLPSPALRCLAGRQERPEIRQRIEKELAALPADAPREVRRDLHRLRWQFVDRAGDGAGFEKMLQSAADDASDPRLALEALMQLAALRSSAEAFREEGGPWLEMRGRIERLAKRLMASDESDTLYALQFGRIVGHRRPATRWGTATAGSNYYGSGSFGDVLPAVRRIIALEDRPAAVREAADLLVNLARGSTGDDGLLRSPVDSFRQAGLLDESLAKIRLPEQAGLSRRTAMLLLMETAGKKAEARGIVAGIHRTRPWDTRWAVKHALLGEDREETFRLLDGVAGRPDFARELLREFFGSNGSADPGPAEYALLAGWLERPQADRSWLGPMAVKLGEKTGLAAEDQAGEWGDLYRRFAGLALADARSAEMAFRSLYSTTRIKDPALVDDAARQALRSGAYTLADLGLNSHGQARISVAPAALEWLVLAANAKGDEVVLPPDFRAELKAADPGMDAWIDQLLATRQAAGLPDLLEDAGTRSGVALAKHEAAMLRAVSLPGREELLEKLCRENRLREVSPNVVHVFAESLRAAAEDKVLEKRLLALLEAGGGPRKGWDAANEGLARVRACVLESAQGTDSAIFSGVLKAFATWQLRIQEGDPAQPLAVLWRRDMAAPGQTKWQDLPGTSLGDALLTGFWQIRAVDGDGKAQDAFRWTFRDSVRILTNSTSRPDLLTFGQEVANNPKATFLDLLRAEAVTGDKAFNKRALKLAAPALEKLPAGIREGVVDELTSDLGRMDIGDLPRFAADALRERLKVQSEAKVKETREWFERMKDAGGLSAGEAGRLAGRVAGEEPELAEEIVAFWRTTQPKLTDADFNAFARGLFVGCGKDVDEVFLRLRMVDRLWAGAPPAWTAHGGEDPFTTAWSLMSWGRPTNPQVWPRFATLSPRMQVRLVLGAWSHFRAGDVTNEAWRKESRQAAKSHPLAHHAFGWSVETRELEDHPKYRSTGIAPLGLLESLAAAGATPDELAVVVENVFKHLAQLDNAADVMRRTPALLAGIRELPRNTAAGMIEGVLRLWGRVRLQRQESGQGKGDAAMRAPVHPAETAALLKFVLSKLPGGKLDRHFSGGEVSSLLIALDDDELFDRWTAASRGLFAGDAQAILHLLGKDRVKEALALLPPPGQGGLTNHGASQEFSQETEKLVAKLAALDSPEAFRLRVLLSMGFDARDDGSPAEPREDRIARLAGEFVERRAGLSFTDRMVFCRDLGLLGKANREHVPALDEFAGEMAAKEFRDRFSGQPHTGSGLAASVCLAAVKSRLHAGDPAGIGSLALAIRQAPAGEPADQAVLDWLPVITTGFWQLADRHDAKLPDVAATAIRSVAAALATRRDPEIRAEASLLVHLAARDAASLAADLERCQLAGVAPGRLPDRESFGMHHDPFLLTLLRVSLLHPCAAELMKTLERPSAAMSQTGMLLSLLEEPEIRARLEPDRFLDWTRFTTRVFPPHLEGLKAYAAERRADFDDTQRAKLDALLDRLENPGKQADRELQEQLRREMDQEMNDRMDGFRRQQLEWMRRPRR